MLDELHVENLALIREASLRFSPGFTVLTGETGAGKTALLSACRLLVGERAAKDEVREGARELSLDGRLFITRGVREGADGAEGAAEAAAEAAAPDDAPDDELVITRRVSADGRSRATINGRMASVGELAARCGPLIDLCSQHEHQQLLRQATHRALLDQWAAETIADPKAAYQRAFDEARAAADALAAIEEAAARSRDDLEAARFTLRTIDDVAPLEGEYEELGQTLVRAEHGETLLRAAGGAYEALTDDEGALTRLASAQQALLGAAAVDETLAAFAERLGSALIDVEDAAAELRAYRDAIEFDPETLEEAQERMAAINGLLRRYGPRLEDVFAARERAAALVAIDEDSDAQRERAQRELAAARERLEAAARRLAEAREEAAPRFGALVSREMESLEMGGAALVCEVRDLPFEAWTREGSQRIEFLFRPGAGLTPRPLARIASGGELSRVMLAIKVVLGDRDDVETLLFDEIDAGVGGAVASALAAVLVDLARTHQVIVVTHLAQIAACADCHYRVYRTEGERPETRLERLAGDARTGEIARMLSGDATEISLAHARELLTTARR